MNSEMEKGREPFTAYVDHSFTLAAVNRIEGSNGRAATKPADEQQTRELLNLDEVLSNEPKKIKQILRSTHWSADHGIRRTLWWKICCKAHRDVQAGVSIYQDLVRQVFGMGDGSRDSTLPGFVDISCMHHYHLSEAGVSVARRLVCILGTECPDVIYSPLVFSVACMLLHYMGEEDCYNCLVALIHAHKKYFTQSKLAYDASKYILKDLAKKYVKPCYQQLSKANKQVEDVFTKWMWWIFKDLPFACVIGIMDCYLYEGHKVLYRVALALLQLFHKFILKEGTAPKNASHTERDISQFCEEIENYTSVDKLLKVAFGLRGFSIKELQRLQVKREMYVRSRISSTHPHMITTSPSVASLDMKVRHDLTAHDLSRASDALMTAQQWSELYSWIPARWALLQPIRLFSTSEHGTSLMTFFNKVDNYEPTIIVIKTMKREVFGAFCSTDWSQRKTNSKNLSFFGTGETFLFSLSPGMKKYDWVGKSMSTAPPPSAELFLSADLSQIQIGGGNGVGICLDAELHKGRSERCDTFNNPSLASCQDFECGTVEVYGFEGSS